MIDIGYINVILTAIAVIAAIISVVLFVRTQRKKRLQCIKYNPIPLFKVKETVKEKIKIFYGDKIVENLFLMEMKIINSGNVSIRKDDIVSPIQFQFDDKTNVIDWSVINTKPKDIPANLVLLQNENNKVQCNFDLLNAKDELGLQFICTGKPTEITIHGRIEEVKEIKIVSEDAIKRKESIMEFIGFIIAGLAGALITGLIISLIATPF